MKTFYKNIEYSEGNKIEFVHYDNHYTGEICFGEYEDGEFYSTYMHLGFFVKYKGSYGDEQMVTLPDAINEYSGKLI
jgi:hypothetical protein